MQLFNKCKSLERLSPDKHQEINPRAGKSVTNTKMVYGDGEGFGDVVAWHTPK